jgi:hypothetical protein
MAFIVFDKTDKGREEIASRKYGLPPRMRALLLLFDGRRSTEEILDKVLGMGLSELSIRDLLKEAFITRAKVGASTVAVQSAATDPLQFSAPTAQPAHADSQPDMQARLEALHTFFTDTIRSAIGLRGYALQLKVERARSLEDFRQMRADYLSAVTKAQGEAMAHELGRQLEQLLPPESPLGLG